MRQGRQDDDIEGFENCQDAIQALLQDIEETDLISYFQIAYALQCDVSKQFALKRLHFYLDSRLLNCKLYYCLGHIQRLVKFAQEYHKIKEKEKTRLQSADRILEELENETNTNLNVETSLFQQLEDNGPSITLIFVNKILKLGLKFFKTKSYDDAEEIFEMCIEIIKVQENQIESQNLKTIHQLPPSEKEIENHFMNEKKCVLEHIGLCCFYLDQYTNAICYYKQLLKINKDKGEELITGKIGSAYLAKDNSDVALKYLLQPLKEKERLSHGMKVWEKRYATSGYAIWTLANLMTQ